MYHKVNENRITRINDDIMQQLASLQNKANDEVRKVQDTAVIVIIWGILFVQELLTFISVLEAL